MYYLQSRFYDPNIGRFINADAADYADLAAVSLSDTNLFAYCGNNPVMYEDSEGTVAIVVGLTMMGIGAAINLATSYIAAKVTGQEFTAKDAIVAVLAGAAASCPLKIVKVVGTIFYGIYSGYTAYHNGASLGGAILSGSIAALSTIASVGNLTEALGSPCSTAITSVADFVIGVGNNSISASTYTVATGSYKKKSTHINTRSVNTSRSKATKSVKSGGQINFIKTNLTLKVV
jgi:RHS repeat-associated protein